MPRPVSTLPQERKARVSRVPVSPSSLFPLAVRQAGLPEATPEWRFHATRRWRFDFAWPEQKVAVEVEGGAWIRGRHTRGAGFVGDMSKYNSAALLGWRVFRVEPKNLNTPGTLEMLKEALAFRIAPR
jgi:hypothetical protein